MRIHRIVKARKDAIAECEICRKMIVKGEPYKTIRPRYGAQRYRHEGTVNDMAHPDWRPSEMTSSDKLSTLYAAQESITDALENWTEAGDLADALNLAADQAQEAADGYQEAADADDKGGAISQTNQEKADAVTEWVDALQSAALEIESSEPEGTECTHCGKTEEEHEQGVNDARRKEQQDKFFETIGWTTTPQTDTPVLELDKDLFIKFMSKDGTEDVAQGDAFNKWLKDNGWLEYERGHDDNEPEEARKFWLKGKTKDKVESMLDQLLEEDDETSYHVFELDDSEWRAEIENQVEEARDALMMP